MVALLGCTWWSSHEIVKDQVVLQFSAIICAHATLDIDSSILIPLSTQWQLLSASACSCLLRQHAVSAHTLYSFRMNAIIRVAFLANGRESAQS